MVELGKLIQQHDSFHRSVNMLDVHYINFLFEGGTEMGNIKPRGALATKIWEKIKL